MMTKQTNEFDSSMIKSSTWNPKTLMMGVTFGNGVVYEYSGVSKEDYLEFCSAASQGKALNELIKPKYTTYNKIEA